MALALPSKDALRWSGDKVISRASMIMFLSLFSVNHRWNCKTEQLFNNTITGIIAWKTNNFLY